MVFPAAILILGLVLRLINLNQSLWLDEAVQAITSQGSLAGIFTELRGDFHPPLYHLLMWGWAHLFGNGEIAMRLPSVFFGTATIWVVYLIAKSFASEESWPHSVQPATVRGVFAALLMATAPFHVYYSQEARMYAMTAFFATLSMYYFIRVISNQRLEFRGKKPITNYRLLVTGYILSTTLLLYSDYYGLFVLLAQIIAVAVIFRKKLFSKFLSKYLNIYITIILLFLPCLPLLWIQLKTGSQATAILPEWGRLVNLSFLKALPLTFIKFSIGRITIFNKTFYAIVAVILFLVYGAIIVRGFLKSKKIINLKSLFIILTWLLIPILSAWLISFFIPNYQPFRLLLVLPAFYLLLVYGVSHLPTILLRCIIVGFILMINLTALIVYYKNPYFHREDWRGAVRYIESQDGKNSLALIPSKTSHWPYTYYSKGKVPLLAVSQDIKPVKEADLINLSENKLFSIYYLYYLADLFDPQGLIPNWLENQKFAKIREVSFNQIRIQEWSHYE